MIRKILSAVIIGATLAWPSASFAETTELKTLLQSSLQRSIERKMIEGAFHIVNFETGEMEKLYPIDTHPMIVVMGENYVMCSDLKRADGSSVTVDYYMAKRGERYTLVQTEIENRDPLKALMDSGKAEMLN